MYHGILLIHRPVADVAGAVIRYSGAPPWSEGTPSPSTTSRPARGRTIAGRGLPPNSLRRSAMMTTAPRGRSAFIGGEIVEQLV